ncbi:MAG: FKBP-type peptidyl-prolyl cis-trans isomerase [Bacteroidota bacterium]|nr:FKBP-type peptidyl-prolyl cis-trans isomerase [Bacteroidota bacterium]
MKKYHVLAILVAIISISLTSCKNDEKREIDDRNTYLETNNIDVAPTASGLYYVETLAGTGVQAKAGDEVKVHYKGMFLDGTVFDSSIAKEEPLRFQLGVGDVIKGWDEGIALMNVGGKATLVVPSDLAYGSGGFSIIPPYSTLVFEVELLEIMPPK